jgi:hypothetical protein
LIYPDLPVFKNFLGFDVMNFAVGVYICLCHPRLYDLENYGECIIVTAYGADADLTDIG